MYPEVVHQSEAAAKAKLQALGFLPGFPPATPRFCFKCGVAMRLGQDGHLRCTGKKKCRAHYRADTAYTPLHNI